jgi:O-antigen ligase
MESSINLLGVRGGKMFLGVFFSLVSLSISLVVLNDPDSATVVLLALIATLFVFRQPLLGILLVLVLTSTIFGYGVLPSLNVLGADIEFPEVLIILTFLATIAKYGSRNSYKRCISSKLTKPLIIFLVIVSISIAYSIFTYPELETTTVLARSRFLFTYVLFFPTLILLREEKDFKFFVHGLLVVAFFVAGFFIITAIFGVTSLHDALRMKFDLETVNIGASSDAMLTGARFKDTPGISLIVSLMFIPICLFIYNHSGIKGLLYGALGSILTIPILLTFTRMTWVTILFALVILLLIVRKKLRPIAKLTFFTGCIFVIAFLALSFHPRYSRIISFSFDRLTSFFVENVETETAVWRLLESKVAIEIIGENPIAGLGIAGELESMKVDYGGKTYYLRGRYNIHNSYLLLALKLGIPALLVFLIIYFRVFKRGWQAFKISNNVFMKGLSLGLFISLLRILFNALSQNHFYSFTMVPCLAISFAIIEAIRMISYEVPEPLEDQYQEKRHMLSSGHGKRLIKGAPK